MIMENQPIDPNTEPTGEPTPQPAPRPKKQVAQMDSNGIFVGVAMADESPLEPGVFLLPGGCVDMEAPVVPNGKRARKDGAAWVLEDIPPAPGSSAREQRMAAVTSRLMQIDFESMRAARAAMAATAKGRAIPAFDANKLDTLETEAATLRAELQTLRGTT